MDIQGEIGYNPKTIDISVKGELVPWTIIDSESNKEIDLSDIEDNNS